MRKTHDWLLSSILVSTLMFACSSDEPATVSASESGASTIALPHPSGTDTQTDSDGASHPETSAAMPPANQPPTMSGGEISDRDQGRGDRDGKAQPRAEDPDDDAITFEYRWSVNGKLVSEAGDTLPHAKFSRGDEIQLTVRASDGADSSAWWREDSLPVANADPRITSIPGDFEADGSFRYPIVVDDPDGDRSYRYEVRQAPSGMQIDAVSGTLQWTPSPGQSGIHPVVIAVDDRHGGVAVQEFDVSVRFEDSAPPASPSP